MKKVTMEDLAKISGYSRPTVSRALSNSTSISHEVRKKIQRLAKDMNYRPNIAAKSLAKQKTGIIGFYIYEMDHTIHPAFSPVLKGATVVTSRSGSNILLILVGDENNSSSYDYIDGLIVSTQETTDKEIGKLAKEKIPFVLLDRSLQSNYPVVSIDYEHASYEITSFLYKKGHRRIAHISGPLQFWVSTSLISGYRKALIKYGISEYLRYGSFIEKDGYQLTTELLQASEPPTAIFCEDYMAMGALKAAKDLGLKVPEALAIVGINDIPSVSSLDPPLSSFNLPRYTLGEKAAEMMLAITRGEELGEQRICLRGELRIRSSC